MRKFFLFWAVAGLALAIAPTTASADCDTLAFEVNDYGKEGPTRDALALLDKHIVSTMAKRGINEYRVGEKTVNCKLFLDFIVFDEHTCTAQAPVCWGKNLRKIKAPTTKAAAPKAAAPKADNAKAGNTKAASQR